VLVDERTVELLGGDKRDPHLQLGQPLQLKGFSAPTPNYLLQPA
jgi:class 3 adenylate cyclase